jgi:hypothetical protein
MRIQNGQHFPGAGFSVYVDLGGSGHPYGSLTSCQPMVVFLNATDVRKVPCIFVNVCLMSSAFLEFIGKDSSHRQHKRLISGPFSLITSG